MSTITQQETPQQETTVPTGTFNVDAIHSALGFEVRYMGISLFKAPVKDFGATLVDGRLTGAAQIASVEVKDEGFHGHLLSPEFFDAAQHPEVTFSGDLATTGSDRVTIDGEITIKGISKPATLEGTITGPVTDPYGNPRYGLDLKTTIDRTEFDLNWNADMPDGTKALANKVTLKAELSLVAAA
jgi:polyisoprenoid-binding protein YceI